MALFNGLTVEKTDPVYKISVSPNSVFVGSNAKLQASNFDKKAAYGKITYSVTPSGAASIDASTGIITTKKTGKITIKMSNAGSDAYNPYSSSATLEVKKFSAPSDFGVKYSKKGAVLSWSKISGISGYYIYRNGGSKAVKTLKSTVSSWTDTSAKTEGSSYSYRIAAYTAAKTSAKSASVSYMVPLKTPDAPDVTYLSGRKLLIEWDKNTNVDGYEVLWAKKKDFSSAKVHTEKKTKTYFRIKNVKKNKYYFMMRTYKKSGKSTEYSSWSKVSWIKINKLY